MRTSEVMALAESTAGPAKDTPAARMPAATSVASFWATYERARGSACGSRGVGEVWEVVAGGRGAKKAAASWFKRLGSFRGPGPAVAAEKCGARDAMREETYRGLGGLERVGPEEQGANDRGLHLPQVDRVRDLDEDATEKIVKLGRLA